MFTREKYSKNNQASCHTCISKNIIPSNKYNQRTYQKTKKTAKKNKCDRLWKKQSSYNYFGDKENDKNNSNYNYNKKFYYDNKKKSFRYQKKIFKTEFDDNSSNKEENNKTENESCGENENNVKMNKDEYDSKEELSKDEKNNSIEYTITTAYSTSLSTHEESNNNIININDNLNINEFKLNWKELNHSDDNNDNKFYSYNENQEGNFLKKATSEGDKQENIKKDKYINLNSQYFQNSTKNLNLIRLNSCPNPINDFSSLSSSQIPKIKNKNKISEHNSIEPYNKYNSFNQELNQFWINPFTENTEILNVNVKISKNKSVIFKLRRFDDLFLTVKLFCEINSIDEKFMKPIIIKALCALNNIYQVFNTQIDENNIKRIKMINTFINNTFI